MNDLTIVAYHYVRDLKNSRYPKINGLDVGLFEEQIKYIVNRYNVITMEEVIYSIDNKKTIPNRSILLTFDDAYSDHYNYALPILDKYNVQGSFYIPVKVIIENTMLDVNMIHFILASVDNARLIVDDLKKLIEINKLKYKLFDFDYYYSKLANSSRYDSSEVRFIKGLLQFELDEEIRSKIINILFDKYVGVSQKIFSKELYLNRNQLEHMLRCGMHIGSHGYNHYWWNKLDKQSMENELDLSLKFLQEIGINMNNWTACYPYGSYDKQSINMLKQKRCKLAVTVDFGIATASDKRRLIMPRIDANDITKKLNNLL